MNHDRTEELRWAIRCYMNVVVLSSFAAGFICGAALTYAYMKK